MMQLILYMTYRAATDALLIGPKLQLAHEMELTITMTWIDMVVLLLLAIELERRRVRESVNGLSIHSPWSI